MPSQKEDVKKGIKHMDSPSHQVKIQQKHVWTGQGFCSVKEAPKHGPSIMAQSPQSPASFPDHEHSLKNRRSLQMSKDLTRVSETLIHS